MLEDFVSFAGMAASLVSVIAAVLGKVYQAKREDSSVRSLELRHKEVEKVYKTILADGKLSDNEIEELQKVVAKFQTDLATAKTNPERSPEIATPGSAKGT